MKNKQQKKNVVLDLKGSLFSVIDFQWRQNEVKSFSSVGFSETFRFSFLFRTVKKGSIVAESSLKNRVQIFTCFCGKTF